MRESSFIEDWIQEGIEQGQMQGIVKAQHKAILQILRARFNLSSQQVNPLARRLEAIDDSTRLEELVDRALRDVTWTDFDTRLQTPPPIVAERPTERPHLGA